MKTKLKAKSKTTNVAAKPRSKDATCQKLLDAGLKIFCKHGYDGATTKLVAKESGVNESLINRYFQGKQGLLHTIIETFAKSFSAKLAVYPQGQTLEEEIYNYCSFRFETLVENQSFLKIAISRSLIETETKSRINKVLEETTHQGAPQILVDRLTALQKEGLIRADVHIDRAALAVSSMSIGILTFGFLQRDLDKNTIHKTFQDFSRDYAKGLSPL
jgi:AcrR family transcriptional regulator